MAAPEWDGDRTTDGRFSINSEHVRGEDRWYWLEPLDPGCREAFKGLDLDGSYDKRTIKRQARRVAAIVDGGRS